MFRILKFLVCLCAFAGQIQAAKPLFDDPVLVKGKSIEIRESDLEEAFVGYKAARAGLGQGIGPAAEKTIRQQVLEKLIATKLFMARATPADREEGKKTADKVIAEAKATAPSEAAFRRQILALGITPEKYEAEILEQAVVKAVIDRELKNKVIVSDAEVKKFYDENLARFQEPEKVKVEHILFSARKIPSGELLPAGEIEQKRKKAKALANQLKSSREDFSKLVAAHSEEPPSAQKKGELVVVKGGKTAPPAFEAAAFSLKQNQVSDVVESPFGFHIIKMIEKIPPATTPIDKVGEGIRSRLQEQQVQEKLPDHIKKLRQEGGIQLLTKND